MPILIIYAHPETKGYSPTILQEVKKELNLKKEKFEVLDLYKMNYDPILSAEEHYSAGNTFISKENKEIQGKIKLADKLIFIFPDWWGGMPAILKGFIDRVFVKDFAFTYSPKGMPVKLLKGKKVLAFISHGGPWVYHFITGKKAATIMKNIICKYCGMKANVEDFYSANKLNEKAENKIKKLISKSINKFI